MKGGNRGLIAVLGTAVIVSILVAGLINAGYIIPKTNQQVVTAGGGVGNISASAAFLDAMTTAACTCTGGGLGSVAVYDTNGVFPVAGTTALTPLITTLGSTATNIGIKQSMNMIVGLWADKGITTDYIDPAQTISQSNGLITSYQLLSLDNSGNLNILFKADLSRVGINVNSAQAVNFVFRSLSDDDANVVVSSPPAQTGVGTGTKQVSITWYLQYSASGNLANNKGYSIARVYVTSNETTFQALGQLTNLQIAYTGQLYQLNIAVSGSSIIQNSGAKEWDVNYAVRSDCSGQFSGGSCNYRMTYNSLLIGHKLGDIGSIAITATFNTFFTATGGNPSFGPTIKVDLTKPNNVAATQLTNTVRVAG